MTEFTIWWTGLTRGQQDIAVLVIVFVSLLLATRWGMYDGDMRTRVEGRPLAAPRWARRLFLWGIPTVATLLLAWGMWG